MDRICCFSYRSQPSGRPPKWAEALTAARDCVTFYGCSIKSQVCSTAKKAYDFVVRNKYNLLCYAVAWGVILFSIGMLHGFKRTTAPFSIGMGAGVGVGLLGGLIGAYVFRWKNSLGGRITGRAMKHLDLTTRTIALTMFVGIYIILATRLPHMIGAVSGILVGEHLAVAAFWGKEMVKQAQSIEDDIKDQKARLDQLEQLTLRQKQALEELQNQIDQDRTRLQQQEALRA